jgi:hypothetical protein
MMRRAGMDSALGYVPQAEDHFWRVYEVHYAPKVDETAPDDAVELSKPEADSHSVPGNPLAELLGQITTREITPMVIGCSPPESEIECEPRVP